MNLFESTVAQIGELDSDAMEKAQAHLDFLLKPQGSLGMLEENAVKLAGITGSLTPELAHKTIIVMCADHGIAAQGISSFPQEVSGLIAETMVKGLAGVAVLANHAGASIRVVDIGLLGDVNHELIISRKIARGTADFSITPAMSRDQMIQAIEIGIEEAQKAIEAGAQILGTGEVGIGNTTASTALLCAVTEKDPEELTGRGAGLSDDAFEHKKTVIREALARLKPRSDDPLDALMKVGGFEIAGLVGVYLAGAAARIPVVIDGFIAGVAALVAVKINSKVKPFLFASHKSEEPGAVEVARQLELNPILDMHMRLGEGTGAALAFHCIEASVAIMKQMGTFADIGMGGS